ncbi:MAG: lipoprotein-releasing ABC transporter permease subunit [Gammaproteobacteria bacterium]
MPFDIFVGLRYALSGRRDRFVSFVSMLSAAGIALGVAALLVVLSVMTGFQYELRARILSVASHLEVVSTGEGFVDWREVAGDYLSDSQILAAAPSVQEQGLLVAGDIVKGALIRGILPEEEAKVSDIGAQMRRGALSSLRAERYGIVLGARLAADLRKDVGDELILVAPRGRFTAAGLLPRLRRFNIVGIFSAQVYQYDAGLAYIHLADAQKLYRTAGRITSVRLKTADIFDAPIVRERLSAKRDDVYLHDWTSSHGSLFRALALEKRVMFVILTLIIAVAAFNIVSALVTMSRNKRGDIAILRAMGAGGGAISRIFLLQGALIGGVGTIVGVLAGLPLAANAGRIVATLEEWFDSSLFPGDIYQLGGLPSRIIFTDVLTVAAAAFVLSVLAAVWPAMRSGAQLPADALRHE